MSRLLLATALLVALLATTAFAASGGPTATAAASCSVKGKERRLGATYVTKVSTRRVGCRSALRLVKAYHGCRRRRGGADGRCPRINGFRCRERRTSSPTQYDAKATCRKGGRRVVQQYTQNT